MWTEYLEGSIGKWRVAESEIGLSFEQPLIQPHAAEETHLQGYGRLWTSYHPACFDISAVAETYRSYIASSSAARSAFSDQLEE
jgi:hypothetical protein